MQIDFKKLIEKYNIKITGIIHLGVHYFEEKEIFVSMGVSKFVLVEPQKHCISQIAGKIADIDALVFDCAVFDYKGTGVMHCDDNNYGHSSSLLFPKEHLKQYPEIKFPRREVVQVNKIENLQFDRKNYNVLVMDIQGSELNALKGTERTFLFGISAIFTEINFEEMYEGCAQSQALDTYLSDYGFSRVETGEIEKGWTDAMYLNINDCF